MTSAASRVAANLALIHAAPWRRWNGQANSMTNVVRAEAILRARVTVVALSATPPAISPKHAAVVRGLADSAICEARAGAGLRGK
jgi:hypothetical protein